MSSRIVSVRDLSSDQFQEYVGLTPRQAVIVAYAQSLGDHNTWNYERRYGHLVREGRVTVSCGDWCALKEGQ